MMRKSAAVLWGLIFTTGSIYCQAVSNNPPRVINLDSLSDEDKALFREYKDSFENDLRDFLDVFNDRAKNKIDTTVYDMDRSSHVEVGLDFVSRNLINGRLTGISGVGFYPAVNYFHKTGIYFGIAPGFYTDQAIVKATAVPLVSLSAGYQHTFFRRWFIGIGYAHNFVTYGTSVSRRILDNSFNLSSSVDIWKHLIVGGAVSIYWSSLHSRLLPETEKFSAEIVLTLRKEFVIYKFIGAKVFTISPALNFYFGSDNRAFARQLGTSEVTGDSVTRKAIAKVITNNYFGFLDIEPSVTIDWRIRNLDINVTPVLAIPFNTLNTKTDVRVFNPKVYRFYVQAGIKYLFCIKIRKKGNSGPGIPK